jgi:rRNA maturation protein Nop10
MARSPDEKYTKYKGQKKRRAHIISLVAGHWDF